MSTAYGTGTIGNKPGTTGSARPEHKEGQVAKAIEKETAKLPSDWFLWAGIGSLAASMILMSANRRSAGNFVGLVAPSLLIMGLYNKLVKVAGSDQADQGAHPAR